MESSVRYSHTADMHWFQASYWSQYAGTTNLELYIQATGYNFFSWELISNCPTWRSSTCTEFFLYCIRVNLEHHAINVVRILRTFSGKVFEQCFYISVIQHIAFLNRNG
ncbi:hypothetical protein D3C75_604480 [compost metagenome]